MEKQIEQLTQYIDALAESYARSQQTLRWLFDFSEQLKEPNQIVWRLLCEYLRKFVEWDESDGWLLGAVDREKDVENYQFSIRASSENLDWRKLPKELIGYPHEGLIQKGIWIENSAANLADISSPLWDAEARAVTLGAIDDGEKLRFLISVWRTDPERPYREEHIEPLQMYCRWSSDYFTIDKLRRGEIEDEQLQSTFQRAFSEASIRLRDSLFLLSLHLKEMNNPHNNSLAEGAKYLVDEIRLVFDHAMAQYAPWEPAHLQPVSVKDFLNALAKDKTLVPAKIEWRFNEVPEEILEKNVDVDLRQMRYCFRSLALTAQEFAPRAGETVVPIDLQVENLINENLCFTVAYEGGGPNADNLEALKDSRIYLREREHQDTVITALAAQNIIKKYKGSDITIDGKESEFIRFDVILPLSKQEEASDENLDSKS